MTADADLSLQLALLACAYPGGVADRTPRPRSNTRPGLEFVFAERAGPADAARRRLQQWAQACATPSLQVWAGDNIYIDESAGLFDPALVSNGGHGVHARAHALPEALLRAYAAVHGSLYAIPATRLHAIDDHEIVDNWEPSLHARRRKADYQRMNTARRAFIAAMRHGRLGSTPTRQSPVPLWHCRDVHGLRLFICDTRTERRPREVAAPDQATIMSSTQWAALAAWLQPGEHEREAYTRVIVSPAMLLPRRLSTGEDAAAWWRSDAWDGFPASMHALLAALAEQPRLQALFLSGDEHLPCAVRASVQRADRAKPAAQLLSVHSGAMYAPYPFANSRPELFADEREFGFASDGVRYRCRLGPACFPDAPGDGFVVVGFDARQRPLRVQWLRSDGAVQPMAAADVAAAGGRAAQARGGRSDDGERDGD